MRNKSVVDVVLTCFVIIFLFSIKPVLSHYPLVPDPGMTQGDLCTVNDSDFSRYRYQENIPYCYRNVSWERRSKIYDNYNIPASCRHRYTIDHFIPLSLGGNNSDENLWPEHVLVKATRARLEQELYLALEFGEMSQKEAIGIIVRAKTREKQIAIHSKIENECD